jgi:hypothetical protein
MLSAQLCSGSHSAVTPLTALMSLRIAEVELAFGIHDGRIAPDAAGKPAHTFLERCLLAAGGFFDAETSLSAAWCLTVALRTWPCLAAPLVSASSDAVLHGAAVPLLLALMQHPNNALSTPCSALAALVRAGGERALAMLVSLQAIAVPLLSFDLMNLQHAGPSQVGIPGVESDAADLLCTLFSSPGVLCTSDGANIEPMKVFLHIAASYAALAQGVPFSDLASSTLIHVTDADGIQHMHAALTRIVAAAITAPEVSAGQAVLGAVRSLQPHGELLLQSVTMHSAAAAAVDNGCDRKRSSTALRIAFNAAERASSSEEEMQNLRQNNSVFQQLISALVNTRPVDLQRRITLCRATTLAMTAAAPPAVKSQRLNVGMAASKGYSLLRSNDNEPVGYSATIGMYHFTCGAVPELLLVVDIDGIGKGGRAELARVFGSWAAANAIENANALVPVTGSRELAPGYSEAKMSDARPMLMGLFGGSLPPLLDAAAAALVLQWLVFFVAIANAFQ